jgi:hypothetical protein
MSGPRTLAVIAFCCALAWLAALGAVTVLLWVLP